MLWTGSSEVAREDQTVRVFLKTKEVMGRMEIATVIMTGGMYLLGSVSTAMRFYHAQNTGTVQPISGVQTSTAGSLTITRH